MQDKQSRKLIKIGIQLPTAAAKISKIKLFMKDTQRSQQQMLLKMNIQCQFDKHYGHNYEKWLQHLYMAVPVVLK
jgi:hypothetical protein